MLYLLFTTFWYCRFDLTCKAPEVLYEEVVEIDERVMLSEFFDENKSKEEIDVLEKRNTQSNQWNGKYSPNWPEAGVGKRIKGVTGEKVSVDYTCFGIISTIFTSHPIYYTLLFLHPQHD